MTAILETSAPQRDARSQALQGELQELAQVVGPVPLVDMLFERCFQLNVTDIHFDPLEGGLRVRIRIDGILHEVLQLQAAAAAQVVNRLKLMGGENIVERRHAQDGHLKVPYQSGMRDIRVGSGPTIHGERLVLRVMPGPGSFMRLNELGLEPTQAALLREALSQPNGSILSVGPVGSGKSTLLYSCLEILNDPARSVVSIEDPVERQVPGVNQTQVDPKVGFHFVDALRGLLRQDPEVMMIGEIRDAETAQIGIRASRSGLLVLSTLHANDATASIDILRDFGVPPSFVADSVQMIVSQRLVRRVCQNCRESYTPSSAECRMLGIEPHEAPQHPLQRGRGCGSCFHTGYLGRIGVFETLRPSDEVKLAITQGAPRPELQRIACANGLQTLVQSAIHKVREGITSTTELNRVIRSRPLMG